MSDIATPRYGYEPRSAFAATRAFAGRRHANPSAEAPAVAPPRSPARRWLRGLVPSRAAVQARR